MSKETWIASDDQGSSGTPGQQFYKQFAGVKIAKGGQYELHVRSVSGSNQGYLEEHHRTERKFRADTLDDLLRIGISEIRGDEAFAEPGFAQAIRNAIYAAQDEMLAEDGDTKLLAGIEATKRLEVILAEIRDCTANVIEHGLYGPVKAKDVIEQCHKLALEAIACNVAIEGD